MESIAHNPALVLSTLECRVAVYTIQHFMHFKEIKDIIKSRPAEPCEFEFYRVILRGNRMAAYMKTEKHFDRIGVLGAGTYGTVELVKSKDNEKYYALKMLIAKRKNPLSKYLLIAFIERDSALVLESDHFVKLKASWVELNNGHRPDCFKFLWENMPYGDLSQIIAQLHPMSSLLDNFEIPSDCYKKFFNFHEGTLVSMTEGVDFIKNYGAQEITLACIFAERRIITEGGKLELYQQICFLYLKQMMEAVRFLHSKHITHNDIKPSNVLVAADLTLRIADLGLASAFNQKHLLPQHNWTDMNSLPKTEYEQKLLSGGAKYHYHQYKKTTSRKQRLLKIGPSLYMAPEHSKLYYEEPGAPTKKEFNRSTARNTDWYAIGILTFQLLTGVHPMTQAYCTFGKTLLRNQEGRSIEDLLDLIKLFPKKYNPFLYPNSMISETAFQSLFLDMRLHNICVKLTDPDPRRRMDYGYMVNDPDYPTLESEPFASARLMFHWNALLRNPVPVPFENVKANFEKQKSPESAAAPLNSQRIFAQPGFPIMTGSPGAIPSP